MPKQAKLASLRSLEECNDVLRRIGDSEVAIARMKARCDARVSHEKQTAAEGSQPLIDDIAMLAAQLEAFYEAHSEEIEAGGYRSVKLTHGSFGRRLNPAELVVIGGKAWKSIVEKVRDKLGASYIRQTPAVDKEAIHRAMLDAAKLRSAGLRIKQDDVFWREVDSTKLGAGR